MVRTEPAEWSERLTTRQAGRTGKVPLPQDGFRLSPLSSLSPFHFLSCSFVSDGSISRVCQTSNAKCVMHFLVFWIIDSSLWPPSHEKVLDKNKSSATNHHTARSTLESEKKMTSIFCFQIKGLKIFRVRFWTNADLEDEIRERKMARRFATRASSVD